MKPFAAALLVSFLALTELVPAEPRITITASAGDLERRHALAEFDLPRKLHGIHRLRGADGKLLPVQVAADGRAAFFVDHLPRGAEAKFELVPGESPATWSNQVEVARQATKLKIALSGHPWLEYQAEPGPLPRADIKPVFLRGGYFHPIATPGGRVVSDDYPPNHIHQHGLWSAWTRTKFEGRTPDFWNMGTGKGRVEFVAVDSTWSGPVHGGFTARHRFVDLQAAEPAVALNETWTVRVFNVPPAPGYWAFDIVSTQTCATASALQLPEYHYGGFAFRGNWAWNGKDRCRFLTSEGTADRVKANATRARWCDLTGAIDGQDAGLALLGHPDNYRAPQPLRVHPDEPYFCFAPQQLGDMEITPGRPYVSRYRVIVHDGPPDPALLDRLWNDYARPPAVRVEVR